MLPTRFMNTAWRAATVAALSLSTAVTQPVADHAGPHVLVMHLNWPGSPGPFTTGAINEAFLKLKGYMLDASYGDFDLEWTLVEIDMPEPRCFYVPSCSQENASANNGLAMRDALVVAAGLGEIVEEYEYHVVLSDMRPGAGNGLPSGKVFVGELAFKLLAHEFVHSMNVAHSTLLTRYPLPAPPYTVLCPWDPDSTDPEHREGEYGNLYDVMGSASVFGTDAHVNVRTKNYLGWLPDDRIKNVTAQDMEYVLYQQDLSALPGPGHMALRIRRDDTKDYWVEYRQRLQGGTSNCTTNVDTGVLVYLADKGWRYLGLGVEPFQLDKFDPCQLLDMNWDTERLQPNCADASIDAALQIGEQFCDPEGVGILLLGTSPPIESAGADGQSVQVPGYATVRVTLPPNWESSENEMSSINFLEPPTSVHGYFNPGLVTFLARVADPDGIAEVRFELYAGSELPAATKLGVPLTVTLPPLPGGPAEGIWKGKFNLSSLPNGGFTMVVTVIDNDQRIVSNGTFFSVTR